MFTLTCSLHLTDGQTVAAQIKAASKMEDAPVAYSGPADRLPIHPPVANAIELKSYFRSCARELGAQFEEDERDDRAFAVRDVMPILDQLKNLHPKRHRAH
ncbi:MAG: hypothetical protein U1G07_02535 [Verrucomicrobiota bacterium]